MWALGNHLDLAVGINPVADLAAGANTGKRIHMRNYDTLGVLFFKNAHSAGTDTVTITLNEHTLAASGTSQVLAAITTFYTKQLAAALVGNEPWVETVQAAASTIALTNTSHPAANQMMVAFEVEASAMSAGFEWLSISIADPGTGGTILGGAFYFPTGLRVKRRPDLLAQPNL
jgi:hypothetical protein